MVEDGVEQGKVEVDGVLGGHEDQQLPLVRQLES